MCSIMGFTSKFLSVAELTPFFDRTKSRGPDMSRVEEAGSGYLCFHRLAIMGLTEEGMQPFHLGEDACVCNGELYLFRPLKAELSKWYDFKSGSDCEIILPLYREYGLEMFKMLDAEFAMLIYDAAKDQLIAARDPIGIRPLFYGYLADGSITFASEAKNLVGLCDEIMPFPPGYYYADGAFTRYADPTAVAQYVGGDVDAVCKKIRELLILGIDKRLDADAPLGFLLSGGLDSSLVCAISAKVLGRHVPHLRHRHGHRRHRPEIRQGDGGFHRRGAHRGNYDPAAGAGQPGGGCGPAGHLGHHHHPGQHGDVPVLQSHPRDHRRAGTDDRRNLRRAVRL